MVKQKLANTSAAHKKHAIVSARIAVVTLSSSRSLDTDVSGDLIQHLLEDNGHEVVARIILPDHLKRLRAEMRALTQNPKVQVIITTGGTGLTASDVTIEAVRNMLDKELPGFNALFMMLSYQQVKSAAMMSRAMAGTVKGRILFCLPGSPKACQLAMESLILPELGHALHMLASS